MKNVSKNILLPQIVLITLLLTACKTVKQTSGLTKRKIEPYYESSYKRSIFIHFADYTFQTDTLRTISNEKTSTYTFKDIDLDTVSLEIHQRILENKKYHFRDTAERNKSHQTHIYLNSETKDSMLFTTENIDEISHFEPIQPDSDKVKSSAMLALEITGAAAGTLGGIGLLWLWLRNSISIP
ncbi:MAG: hypothetical protein ACPGVI_06945 [Crocinitomicaceae bacterium]